MTTAAIESPAATENETGPLSYKVRVDTYFGPLDLLLHLVKETEVDITRISLAQVAQQYIDYLSAMEKMDLFVAGEFLVVASQLMLIKTRTMVPPELRTDDEQAEEDEGDTSIDLIRKLLEYKRIKDRARAIDQLYDERARRIGRPHLKIEGEETEQEPLRNMELWDLVLLYSRILKSTRLDVAMTILYRDVPIEVWMDAIAKVVAEKQSVAFSELVGPQRERARVVGTFLAMLQLARQQKVKITQDGDLQDIRLEMVDARPDIPLITPA